MITFVMIGIMALLGFLCVSHSIPGIVEPRNTPRTTRHRARTMQRARRRQLRRETGLESTFSG